jgi:hypothetical protein
VTLTILVVHFLDLEGVLASFDDTVIILILQRQRCKFGPGKLSDKVGHEEDASEHRQREQHDVA